MAVTFHGNDGRLRAPDGDDGDDDDDEVLTRAVRLILPSMRKQP